jgi:hypothetical protein
MVSDLLQCDAIKEILLKILLGHETQVCSYDPEAGQHSSQWKSSDEKSMSNAKRNQNYTDSLEYDGVRLRPIPLI